MDLMLAESAVLPCFLFEQADERVFNDKKRGLIRILDETAGMVQICPVNAEEHRTCWIPKSSLQLNMGKREVKRKERRAKLLADETDTSWQAHLRSVTAHATVSFIEEHLPYTLSLIEREIGLCFTGNESFFHVVRPNGSRSQGRGPSFKLYFKGPIPADFPVDIRVIPGRWVNYFAVEGNSGFVIDLLALGVITFKTEIN